MLPSPSWIMVTHSDLVNEFPFRCREHRTHFHITTHLWGSLSTRGLWCWAGMVSPYNKLLNEQFRSWWFEMPWWRHQMETFFALLAICAGNSPASGEFPSQRPGTRSFDIFFDLQLNKRLSKQSWGWWFETPSCPLWRHGNAWSSCDTVMYNIVCQVEMIGTDLLLWIIMEFSFVINDYFAIEINKQNMFYLEILIGYVRNFKTISQLRNKFWANKSSRDLSSMCFRRITVKHWKQNTN